MSEVNKMFALVVDDDAMIRDLIREILEQEGFQVLEAQDGKGAMQLLSQHASISLIVTDIVMPDRDGVELIANVRRATTQSQRPPKIVAISGGGRFSDSELYLESAKSLGADLTLSKPFSDVALLNVVRSLGLSSST